jgi:hypothetical protein
LIGPARGYEGAVAVAVAKLDDTAKKQRDRTRRRAALRRLDTITAELEAATQRRTELWTQLSQRPDARLAAQIDKLSNLIGTLYGEARALRACASNGSRELILERARHEMLVERDRRPAL